MPKWAPILLSISAAVIGLLMTVVGVLSLRTLDRIETEMKEFRAELASVGENYNRLSQSVAVAQAMWQNDRRQCKFPRSEN